ncbi:hypothetical protein C1Y11_05405 [Pseudomonas sp. FW305-20]|nr:hypothetical protein C1Y11_05405 [Pseudomonas sp. FW305-20]PMU21472.1 hypothetical protein C1Y10_02835 [Pseudomonas sp. FW305-122]PMU42004.1 hypothetical protein C1Y12_05865 [Pseudomonas sp. FW305-47B]PMX65644.1 hypothetical protein C1Y13_00265 [Pseudomonas sp. FW305-33]PMX71411.1 hypothetical protein C1X12_01375 [Pseudomonas sp. FW305-60]
MNALNSAIPGGLKFSELYDEFVVIYVRAITFVNSRRWVRALRIMEKGDQFVSQLFFKDGLPSHQTV